MKIQQATQADLKNIVSLNKLFHLNIPGFRWDTEPWISDEIEQGNFHILKHQKSAYGAVCLHLATEAYIETIAVDKEKQGQGHGKKLIDFCAEEAMKHGKHKLVVESFCEYKLEDFYTKCGFELESIKGNLNDHPYNVFSKEF